MKSINEPQAPETPEDAELARVLDGYLADLEAGKPSDLDKVLAEHPSIADRIRACLTSLKVVEQAVSPIAPIPPDRSAGADTGRIGDYHIIREVGRGGMGIVYEAEQISLGRRVALKILPFAGTLDPKQLQRFKHEARAAAHLHHTNIVPVYAVGSERGVHYYAMPFIDGQTLGDVIRELKQQKEEEQTRSAQKTVHTQAADTVLRSDTVRNTRTPSFFTTVARWGKEAGEALEHAHGLGVIHRDVKPTNLLLDPQGKLWITDFGLARFQEDAGLTLSGDLLGTLRYMSPEQALARHGVVDHRTDVYSLGATLYELLTLEPVFDGKDRGELLKQIAFEDPKPLRRTNPAIPADL